MKTEIDSFGQSTTQQKSDPAVAFRIRERLKAEKQAIWYQIGHANTANGEPLTWYIGGTTLWRGLARRLPLPSPSRAASQPLPYRLAARCFNPAAPCALHLDTQIMALAALQNARLVNDQSAVLNRFSIDFHALLFD